MRYIIILLLISNVCNANDALSSAVEACKADKNLSVCQTIDNSINDVSKVVENILEERGIKDTAAVTAGIAKVVIEQKIKIKTEELNIVRADESSVEISNEKVFLIIKWEID